MLRKKAMRCLYRLWGVEWSLGFQPTRVSRRFSRIPKQRVSFTCVRVFRDIGAGVCVPILDFMPTQRCPWTAYFWGKTHIGAVVVEPIIVFKGLKLPIVGSRFGLILKRFR